MTSMSEPELQAEVIKLCEQLGLLYHHCPAAYRCAGQRGLPDLIIAGPNGMVFAELKGQETETSAEQDRWLYVIESIDSEDVQQTVWRPIDLTTGRIESWLWGLT